MAQWTEDTLEHVGWGLIGEPDEGLLVSTPEGVGLELYGYNASDYWGADGSFLGPDRHSIVPIYLVPDGTQFPPDARPYPYIC